MRIGGDHPPDHDHMIAVAAGISESANRPTERATKERNTGDHTVIMDREPRPGARREVLGERSLMRSEQLHGERATV